MKFFSATWTLWAEDLGFDFELEKISMSSLRAWQEIIDMGTDRTYRSVPEHTELSETDAKTSFFIYPC
jgi:hypothetical protein